MRSPAYFLDTRGRSTYGVGLCARCSAKLPLEELFSDPNSPGLMVCVDDLDVLDPYRLPARETEDITLPFYRPDRDLTSPGPALPVDQVLRQRLVDEYGNAIMTADGQYIVVEIPPGPYDVP